MSVILPKSLISRLSALTGLGAVPVEEAKAKDEQKATPEEGKSSSPHPPLSHPPLAALDDSALTLSLDNLPPRDLAALSLASQRFRSVASSGDAWRLRFEPRLPQEVVERLDESEERRGGGGGGGTEAAASASSSSSASSLSFGWPSTYAALALSNLLRSPLEWEGVALGMRAATAAASEAAASSPAWRVTCHGGHGWEVEVEGEEGPAGCERVPSLAAAAAAAAEKRSHERWPQALMPRSALASSRAAATTTAAPATSRSSWLPRSLLPSPSPQPRQRPLSVASSFSWCEIVQEVDLVFELLRCTSWVSSSPPSGEAAAAEEEEAKKDDDGGGGGGDDGSEKSKPKHKASKKNLCWTRRDAESYLDSSPALVLSFFAASRKDCESSLSASLLALPDLGETGPLPPYHGRANFDWRARTRALAASDLPERAAPWGDDGNKAGKWERMTLEPLKLPAGTRRALVVFRSKDSRFWSGHYGAKLAAPVLAFAATGAELEDAEKAARETERGAEVAAAARELLFAA